MHRDASPENNGPTDGSDERRPYTAPDLTDHGSLEDHTQTRPRDGGGADVGSS